MICNLFGKFSRFEILGMKSIITIRLLVFKKCKNELDQYFVFDMANGTGQSVFNLHLYMENAFNQA